MEITVDELLLFCERTIDGMAKVVERLDDDTVTRRPDLEAANSPYGLVTHALGAFEWWTAHVVCGLPSSRVRSEEFEATGSVAELLEAIARAGSRARELQPQLERATVLSSDAKTQIPLEADWTVGMAVIHAYEELAQHLGHLEITVDLLTAS